MLVPNGNRITSGYNQKGNERVTCGIESSVEEPYIEVGELRLKFFQTNLYGGGKRKSADSDSDYSPDKERKRKIKINKNKSNKRRKKRKQRKNEEIAKIYAQNKKTNPIRIRRKGKKRTAKEKAKKDVDN